MKTTHYVLIPSAPNGRTEVGLHEFTTYMEAVTFLGSWAAAETAAGRGVPQVEITKVRPQQQAAATGGTLLWVVIDPAMDNKYSGQRGDPSRWWVGVPPRETAQRVYTVAGGSSYNHRYVRTQAVLKRFATQEEAEGFKVAAMAVWEAHTASVAATRDAQVEAKSAFNKAVDARAKALRDHVDAAL